MYVAITRAKDLLYLTRSKSRYLYGRREPTARSRFLKELAGCVELPREMRRSPYGYGDYDDPEGYGNQAYGGGRYESNDEFGGRRNSFGGGYSGGYSNGYSGGYSKTYGSAYNDRERSNSGVTRTKWKGDSYEGSSYGKSSYGNSSYDGATYGSKSGSAQKSGGFAYGGVAKAIQPTGGAKDVSVYKVGVKVRHPKFGTGTVVGARGAGSNMIVDVAFEGLGIKQLSASLAPLTVL